MGSDSLSRQTRHRKKRREFGLCGREGCPETSGDIYYCEVHREQARKRAKERAKVKRLAKVFGEQV